MTENDKYGLLLNQNTKLHRQYFREAVKLLGINVLYRSPRPNKRYTNYAEIEANYNPPILIGCLFHDHPEQRTLRKIGWVAELQEGASLIEVDYDLPNLQQGALFIVPSGIDTGKGRLFRLVSMRNSMVYPASITCEIVPEYEDTIDTVTINDYKDSDFNLINEEPDPSQFLENRGVINDYGLLATDDDL